MIEQILQCLNIIIALRCEMSTFLHLLRVIQNFHFIPHSQFPTMGVKWNKYDKVVDCIYGEKFIKSNSVRYNTLVLLHEGLHVALAHLSFCVEELSKLNPKITQGIINIACDFEVNLTLKKIAALNTKMIDTESWEAFEKRSLFPPEKDVNKLRDKIGDVFYWIGWLLRNPDETAKMLAKCGVDGDGIPNNNEGLGSADLDATIPGSVHDRLSNYSRYGSALEERVVEKTQTKVISMDDLKLVYRHLIRKYGEKYTYKKPHKLTTCGLFTNGEMLPTLSLKQILKNLFFIDVSGSMNPKKLGKIYTSIESFLNQLGTVDYVTCDTRIVQRGNVKDASFVNNLQGGGGTNFEEAVHEMVNEGYDHFIFYTDGEFPEFKLPAGLDPNEQVWLLVDSHYENNNFHMPGLVVIVQNQ